jgi:hypothetical protein
MRVVVLYPADGPTDLSVAPWPKHLGRNVGQTDAMNSKAGVVEALKGSEVRQPGIEPR